MTWLARVCWNTYIFSPYVGSNGGGGVFGLMDLGSGLGFLLPCRTITVGSPTFGREAVSRPIEKVEFMVVQLCPWPAYITAPQIPRLSWQERKIIWKALYGF